MSSEQIVFYLFSFVMLYAALKVITARNPVHAALYLVLTFLATSVLWLLLEAEFLAIALVLVYVGAVMVLFLFVIMMLDINIERMREGFVKYLPVGIFIALTVFVQMAIIVGPQRFSVLRFNTPPRSESDYSNTAELGKALYTDYLYAFEIAAALLLVAIVAAISLTLRKRSGTKKQHPGQQIRVQKQDRLRIVKMEAEK